MNFWKPATASFEEFPELGPVDLFQRVDVQLHFLPRPAQVLALHPRLVAVDRQFGQFVERLEPEPLDQVVALERVLGHAELQLQQPFLAGDRVEEPAVGFLRARDFDDVAAVPIRSG